MIRSTVVSALKAVRPGDAMFVIADNCTDQTVTRNAACGLVLKFFFRDEINLQGERCCHLPGLFKTHAQSRLPYYYLVILDADDSS